MIGKIAVSAATFAIDKPYSYAIPGGMQLLPGMRVAVPFGRGNRRCEGIVLAVEEGIPEKLKPVEQVLDAEPLLSPLFLQLAAFLRERCYCSFYDAIRCMLPAELWFHHAEMLTMAPNADWQGCPNEAVRLLMEQLEVLGGEAEGEILQKSFSDADTFTRALQYAKERHWLSANVALQERSRDKTERVASLAVSPEEAMNFASRRPKSAAAQKAAMEYLAAVGAAAVKEIHYYTGVSLPTLKRLETMGLLTLSQRELLRVQSLEHIPPAPPLVLNKGQQAVYEGLAAQMTQPSPGKALLYGITGSGKTSVYVKLIQTALAAGKSAMLLVPEIALTPQLITTLAGYFGSGIAVLHSSLPAGERYDQWKRVRRGEAKVVVGTRSAVFAPLQNPGILILDEEQERSYASENNPRYHAREVALWRGAKENALVLLGSATPDICTMYYAKSGYYTLYTLKNRYNGRNLPKVEIVDLRRELEVGNDSPLSDPLRNAMADTMAAGKQTILFLNRRGNSRGFVCLSCRESPTCPGCSARLTYHSANNRLMCHYCGHSEPVPQLCPKCGGRLRPIGVGTQKVEEDLKFLFPDKEVLRMDTDTVSAVNTHEKLLSRFQQENIPVLVGTQMVAKGLNLPGVTLVGVLDADMSLYTESYRAAENTFSMLTQVIGRAGRGDTPGTAMIQTLAPEHKVLAMAAAQDYDGFYDLEISMRRLLGTPPFGDMTILTFVGEDEAAVLRGSVKFRDSLKALLKNPEYARETCTVLGPAPCPVPKINYRFRYRVTLKGKLNRNLRLLLAHLLRQFALDKGNRGVSAYAETNGLD